MAFYLRLVYGMVTTHQFFFFFFFFCWGGGGGGGGGGGEVITHLCPCFNDGLAKHLTS